MVRSIHRLTAKFVDNVKSPARYADGGGLYLDLRTPRVGADSAAKRWIFRYTFGNRERELGLGSASVVSLAKARDLARLAREQVAAGTDPKSARDAAKVAAAERARAIAAASKAPPTFGECADDLIRSIGESWRNPKHAAQWKMTLKEYAKPIRSVPISEVDTAQVLSVLQPIWTAKPETAARLRGRIERVIDFAKAKGLRGGENPARWRGHLSLILPPRSKLTRGHHAALSYEAIAVFNRKLRSRPAVSARALEFTILTASRTSEVLNATWSEIDFVRKVWTVPGQRMKSGREHRVPLSDAAVAILSAQKPESPGEFIFTRQRTGRHVDQPLSSMAFAMLLRRLGHGSITAHGFRSTFRDWAAEETSFANIVCEAALAHVVGNATEAAYRRGDLMDRRRALMDAWATYCGMVPTLKAAQEAAA